MVQIPTPKSFGDTLVRDHYPNVSRQLLKNLTFYNSVTYKQLPRLVSGLVLVYLGDEDGQLVLRAALDAEPQPAHLLAGYLDHPLLEGNGCVKYLN